jgi:CubicO group peptidase (beta-lactamase class C family)
MRNSFSLRILILSSLFWTVDTKGQDIKIEGLEAKIESLIPSTVNDTTPGLVVGIVHKGELIFSKGYGLANLSYGIPNDPKMIYNLGSVSKQFLGYAFAILQTQGKINVDDPVGKYLENWPEFDEEVTIRNLLTHTSGYREAYTMSNLAGRTIGIDRLTKKECLDVVRKQPKLEFTPGSRFTYNSTAWVILAEILEKVTEQPAHEWVKENVLLPLGMNNTHIESFVGEVLPNAAESYYHDQTSGYGNPKSNRAIFGAAEVYSSIEDLVNWVTNFQSHALGGKEAMDNFLAPYELNDGTSSAYGFGIQNRVHKGLTLYSHTGSHESFLTQIRYYPAHQLGIVALSNFEGNGWLPTNKVAEYLLQEQMEFPEQVTYTPFKMKKSQLQQFEGTYLSPSQNETTSLVLINDTLTIWGGVKLIPISANTFYSTDWGGKFELNAAADGPTQLVVLADSKSTFQKVANWEPLAKELQEYEAGYWSQELETTYHLLVKGDQLIIQHRWLGEVGLKPIAHDLFRSDQGWFLQIERTEENKIAGFIINSNRTLNVFFEMKK